MEPNNCVLIQWPSPCLAQVGTLNAITLKSSIKENGFHTFIGEIYFYKESVYFGKERDLFILEIRHISRSGKVFEFFNLCDQELTGSGRGDPLVSIFQWLEKLRPTDRTWLCLQGYPGMMEDCWGVPVKPCERLASWAFFKGRESGNTGEGLCFSAATNVQRLFPCDFLVGTQILTQVCSTKREFFAFLSFKNNHVFILVDSPLETHGHKPILEIFKGWKKGNVYISRKQCLFVGCVCSCMTLTFTLGQTFPYTRQISFGSQWIFIKSNVKSPIFTFQEWKVFAS